MSEITYKTRLELASNSVDGAFLAFNLVASEREKLPPEIREFVALVNKARELAYDILDRLDAASVEEYFKLRLVE